MWNTQQARRGASPACRSIASGDAPMGGRSPRRKPHSSGRSAAGSSRHSPTCVLVYALLHGCVVC